MVVGSGQRSSQQASGNSRNTFDQSFPVQFRSVGPALFELHNVPAKEPVSNHKGNIHRPGCPFLQLPEGFLKITFEYVESRTGKTLRRTLKAEDFLWLVLQHVLPKGFRRFRDYGFLHGNAKKLLSLVHLVLRVLMQACVPRPKPAFKCPVCQSPMKIKAFTRLNPGIGITRLKRRNLTADLIIQEDTSPS
jgi:hypothetical protein